MTLAEATTDLKPIAYATSDLRPSNGRVFAAIGLILGGLGLIGLGGCFLIGVLISVQPHLSFSGVGAFAQPAANLTAHRVLIVTLYILAFACIGGAVMLLVTGTAALIRLSRL